MREAARRALELIRWCVENERFIVTVHFSQRMDERAIVWPDVLMAIEKPREVRSGGMDDFGRPKWHVAGRAAGELEIELVCVLGEDDDGHTTVFVTIFWD